MQSLGSLFYYQVHCFWEDMIYVLHILIWGKVNKSKYDYFNFVGGYLVEEEFNSFHMVPEGRNEAKAQQIFVLNENDFLTISTTQKRHGFLLKVDNELPAL